MMLRTRLRHLEAKAAARACLWQPPDVFARIEAHAAYLRGEGPRPPDPPCPPWIDPAAWASRMRIAHALDVLARGDLAGGEYPADLTADERQQVEGYLEALRMASGAVATGQAEGEHP
jgi:hypothetical protein